MTQIVTGRGSIFQHELWPGLEPGGVHPLFCNQKHAIPRPVFQFWKYYFISLTLGTYIASRLLLLHYSGWAITLIRSDEAIMTSKRVSKKETLTHLLSGGPRQGIGEPNTMSSIGHGRHGGGGGDSGGGGDGLRDGLEGRYSRGRYRLGATAAGPDSGADGGVRDGLDDGRGRGRHWGGRPRGDVGRPLGLRSSDALQGGPRRILLFPPVTDSRREPTGEEVHRHAYI